MSGPSSNISSRPTSYKPILLNHFLEIVEKIAQSARERRFLWLKQLHSKATQVVVFIVV